MYIVTYSFSQIEVTTPTVIRTTAELITLVFGCYVDNINIGIKQAGI